jgi:hypothetical protein
MDAAKNDGINSAVRICTQKIENLGIIPTMYYVVPEDVNFNLQTNTYQEIFPSLPFFSPGNYEINFNVLARVATSSSFQPSLRFNMSTVAVNTTTNVRSWGGFFISRTTKAASNSSTGNADTRLWEAWGSEGNNAVGFTGTLTTGTSSGENILVWGNINLTVLLSCSLASLALGTATSGINMTQTIKAGSVLEIRRMAQTGQSANWNAI